jgi:DNA repair exonuclease SbcCD ATPase subunit
VIYARYRTLFPLLCISLLIGCTPDYLNPSFSPGGHYYNGNQLAKYFHHLSDLPLEQLIQEYEAAKLAYKTNENYANTLRYVLFLLLPNPELNDSTQAERILESVLRSNKNEIKSLENISLLLTYFVKKINKDKMLYEYHSDRLEDEIDKNRKQLLTYQKLNKKLRDTVRKKIQQDVRYQKLDQELKEKSKTIETLQKKIEELKTIERNLNQRRNTKSPTT